MKKITTFLSLVIFLLMIDGASAAGNESLFEVETIKISKELSIQFKKTARNEDLVYDVSNQQLVAKDSSGYADRDKLYFFSKPAAENLTASLKKLIVKEGGKVKNCKIYLFLRHDCPQPCLASVEDMGCTDVLFHLLFEQVAGVFVRCARTDYVEPPGLIKPGVFVDFSAPLGVKTGLNVCA